MGRTLATREMTPVEVGDKVHTAVYPKPGETYHRVASIEPGEVRGLYLVTVCGKRDGALRDRDIRPDGKPCRKCYPLQLVEGGSDA